LFCFTWMKDISLESEMASDGQIPPMWNRASNHFGGKRGGVGGGVFPLTMRKKFKSALHCIWRFLYIIATSWHHWGPVAVKCEYRIFRTIALIGRTKNT
jgi:hypothetical protein